jgi:hypothetical protein
MAGYAKVLTSERLSSTGPDGFQEIKTRDGPPCFVKYTYLLTRLPIAAVFLLEMSRCACANGCQETCVGKLADLPYCGCRCPMPSSSFLST